jgi:serine/threonine protein kinase
MTMNKARSEIARLPIVSKNVTMVHKKMSSLSTAPSGEDSPGRSGPEATRSQQGTHSDSFGEKYRLGRKLGEGSSGCVHECFNLKSNKIYACKSMMFDDEHVPSLRKNFLEVQQLNHPNIVKYKALYLDLEKHLALLVMEYVNLPSLMTHIRGLRRPQETVPIA